MLPRRASSTRTSAPLTDGCNGSTFQTPCPPLPRFCLSTRGPADRSRDGNSSRNAAGGAIEMGVRAPAEMLRAVQDFLHAHLEDDVGMGADPDSRATRHRAASDRALSRFCPSRSDRPRPARHRPPEAARAPRPPCRRHRPRARHECRARPAPRRCGGSGCSAASPRAAPARSPRQSIATLWDAKTFQDITVNWLFDHHPGRLQQRKGDQADHRGGGDQQRIAHLPAKQDGQRHERRSSAVSQSPMAMRPSRMQAPRMVPIAAA